MPRDEAELEVALRAVQRWGVEAVVAPRPAGRGRRSPARRGHRLNVDGRPSRPGAASRTPAELTGIRRAQRAAEAGMAAGEELIRGAERRTAR